MALDKHGVPIPVYVPPPPPPPGAVPPNQPSPSVENDVNLLKGQAESLAARFTKLDGLAGELARTSQRAEALERLDSVFTQFAAKFSVIEEAVNGLPKLIERIEILERAADEIRTLVSMATDRMNALEKQLFAMQEKLGDHVHPIPPA
jgi:prefoldin subunit 5